MVDFSLQIERGWYKRFSTCKIISACRLDSV